jgi:hypothetical protein
MSTTASSNQQQSNESRPKETKHLHFDLSHYPSHDNFTLHAGAIKHEVKRHTSETRALLAKQKGLLGLIQPTRLTHYVEAGVELPADTPIMLRLTSAKRPEGAKLDTFAIAAIHVPSEARTKALRERWRREEAAGLPMKPYPKLEALGVKAPRPDAPQSEKIEYQKLIIEAEDIDTAFDVARTLISHHPELMSLDKDTLAKVQAHLDYLSETSNLADSIYDQAGKHAKDSKQPNWVNSIAALGIDLKTPDETRHIYDWSDETKTYAATAIGKALIVTKNDPDLENWCYVVQPGTTSVGGTHQPPPAMFAKFNRHTRRALAAEGARFTTRDVTPNSGVEYSPVSYADGKFSMQVTNDWIRWLSVYVEFLGANGAPIVPEGWQSRLPPAYPGFESLTKKYLQWCPARRTILGIPIEKNPITVEFDWPKNVAGARILCGGLGAHGEWDTTVCLAGAILTGIINFFLVTVFLAAGARFVWTQQLDAVIAAEITAVLALLQAIIAGGTTGGLTHNIMPFLFALANAAAAILVGSMKAIATWLAASIGEAWAEDAVPIVGWVCIAIAVAANTALLAQTTVEVMLSYCQIEVDINKVMDVTLTVHPDPKSTGGNSWPSQSDHWKATLQYEDGTTWENTSPLDPKSSAIQVAFPALPAGGRLKAIFAVYSKDDWLCGRGETDFLPAPYDAAAMAIPPGPEPFCITQYPVPLTVNTQYQFAEKLVVESNVHVWSLAPAASAPTATGPLPHGAGLAELVGITLNEPTGALGYVWQASGLNLKDCASQQPLKLPFAFQNISVVPAHDQNRPSPNCGFAQPPYLLYDLLGPADGKARNFYFDPRIDANANTFPNHLRQVILDGTTPFSTAVGKSFGRFNLPMNSLAIHPAGYVVGISTASHKMEVLPLSATPFDDASAPTAVMKGGCGYRPGLFHSPLAVVTTMDGRILVLDQNFQPNFDSLIDTYPARIQALDVNGNPVPCFADGSSKSPQMLLRSEAAPITYLDMGIESKGYIYVLKCVGAVSQPANYMLDIYQPDGTFLVQTKGVTAGKMVVSFWRDVYTLNYEQITGPNGPEPSVSKWFPLAAKT